VAHERAAHQRAHRERDLHARAGADRHDPRADRRRRQGGLKRRPEDGVEHDVVAVARRTPQRLLKVALEHDDLVGAELAHALQGLAVAPRGHDPARPGPEQLRGLDADLPDDAGRPEHEHRLADRSPAGASSGSHAARSGMPSATATPASRSSGTSKQEDGSIGASAAIEPNGFGVPLKYTRRPSPTRAIPSRPATTAARPARTDRPR
jgi:hypothetical protein